VNSLLCQAELQNHVVSCCRPGAEYQFRPEGAMRTDFREPDSDSARCLTGEYFRLSPDGFGAKTTAKATLAIISGGIRIFFALRRHI